MKDRVYVAIDLKSFYASVECVERKLNPLTTNLVVADNSRTDKTICLAVTPSLKKYGISGRSRLFEVKQRIKEINKERLNEANNHFVGESFDSEELDQFPNKSLSFIVATPRMAKYMEYSAKIYDIYLKYISHEDIHVYSIDEVFIDVTNYLTTYKLSSYDLAKVIILDILETVGITSTAGIGSNLYLAKVAMDIQAKKIDADEHGVRIATLDEKKYRELLWNHKPLTDFWRIGAGYNKKLRENGMYTMGDIARCSLGEETGIRNEDLLYRLFGVNAELLIDHAWGYESCTMENIKNYKPSSHTITSGQVLLFPYSFEKTRVIVYEMLELMTLDLVAKKMVTNSVTISVGYDIDNITEKTIKTKYQGEVSVDRYGRKKPKSTHGSVKLTNKTSSTKIILKEVLDLYDQIVDDNLLIRRITIGMVIFREEINEEKKFYKQYDIFTDQVLEENKKKKLENDLEKERNVQKAILSIKKKYGKNSILKGTNLVDGATTVARNKQIGGHKS